MKGWIYGMCLLFLTACTLEPFYSRPCIELPTAWREQDNEESTLANVRWWQALEDPVLDALILTALQNNNDLKLAIWRVFEYYGEYQVVRSALFPQINFQASAMKEKFPEVPAFPPGVNPITPDYKFLFTLSYQIDLWGQLRSATHAAYDQLLAQVENRRNVVLTLVSAVAEAYVFLRQLDLELQISQKTLKSREESLTLAKYRFEGGLTSEIEVVQAAASYEETLARVVNLERQIPQQENLISILLGKNPTCIIRGKAVDELMIPIQVPEGLPSDLLQRRPDVVMAENLLMAATAQVGVARAAFFPQITLTGFYGGESPQLKHLFSGAARTWQIGGNLFQPLFNGGRLIGQLNVVDAERQEAIYHYQQVILNAFKEVDDSLIAHDKAKQLIGVEQARVAALKEYLNLAWLRYYEGENDYLTVLDAERHLFEAELNLAEAQGNLFITLIEIYKSLGGGWVIDADDCLTNE